MVLTPVPEAGPARRLALAGVTAELAVSRIMEGRIGLPGEAYTTGQAHKLRRRAELLNTAGLVGTALLAGRSRLAAVASGLALLAGSVYQRFGTFEAGVASTKDPRYVVVPQRERLTGQGG
jgi:hypothetical protein